MTSPDERALSLVARRNTWPADFWFAPAVRSPATDLGATYLVFMPKELNWFFSVASLDCATSRFGALHVGSFSVALGTASASGSFTPGSATNLIADFADSESAATGGTPTSNATTVYPRIYG